MGTIAIAYVTEEGQAERVALRIADVVQEHGYEARVTDLRRRGPAALDGCDAVVVCASIHMGRHEAEATAFVRDHLDALGRVPTAFVSVSLAAHGDLDTAQGYVDEFAAQTGWHPSAVALVAGALVYTRYGFVKRRVMRRIARAKPGGLDVDTSRDYEYTDWEALRRFTEDFLAHALPAPLTVADQPPPAANP